MHEDSIHITPVAQPDSLATDSVATASPPALILSNPAPLHEEHPHTSPATANSWILLVLFLLFAAVCFKIKNNSKYFTYLFRDLTNVRERSNAFDDTVRETSFVTLLNVLCAVSAAILIYSSLTPHIPGAVSSPLLSFLLCLGATSAYCLILPPVYWLVGDIFSDQNHAKMWVNGFLASQGVLGVALFPPAIVSLFYPGAVHIIIPVSLIILIIVKLLFITKGFRIFFTKYSSWITFLYYLCSLEIVPLILTFVSASFLVTTYVI